VICIAWAAMASRTSSGTFGVVHLEFGPNVAQWTVKSFTGAYIIVAIRCSVTEMDPECGTVDREFLRYEN
jgi:hypothetical protein